MTERKLRVKFKAILDGYADDYFSETNTKIPNDYLESELETALSKTLSNTKFIEFLNEYPIDKWEDEWWVLEFLFQYSNICELYPMV